MNKKIAQMDPAAAPPPMDPMAMGAPPMDPMAMGMGGPPTMPMAAPGAPPTSREEIGSPLDSLGKILYDVDITTLLLSRIGDTADDTSLYVWLMYGGDEHGGSMKDRVGKRLKKKDVKKEQEKAEQERTEDSRWERLPSGKKITDITSLDEMTQEIQGIAASAVRRLNPNFGESRSSSNTSCYVYWRYWKEGSPSPCLGDFGQLS